MKRILLASASIAACMLGAGLGAGYALAETELEEIVVKTNFNTTNFVNPDIRVMDGQVLLTAPANVTVIDRERFNLDTVNYTNTRYELMPRVPGMTDVRNLRVPCGWCDYTVNLQNGLATRPLGRGNFNFDSANNFDIERIEIIKGPASALYPSHAFGGVINVITRKPSKTPTLRIFSDVGSWDRYRFGFDFGFTIDNAHIQDWQLGSLGLKANASHYELDGWREWRGEEKNTASVRLTWEPRAKTRFETGAGWTKYYDEDPGTLTAAQWLADWGQAPRPSTSLTKTTTVDARVVHSFANGHEFQLPYGYVHERSISRWGNTVSDRHDLKPRYTATFDFWKSRLTTGVDLSRSDTERLGRSDTKATIVSPYAQHEFSPFTGPALLEGVKFTAGVRYEYTKYDYADFNDPTNNGKKSFSKATPHTGVTWRWHEKNSLWFSYSQGYSAPSPRRMWPDAVSRGDMYIDNPDLKPERAENFEIGARGSLLDDRIIYDVSWHHTTIRDFIQKEFVRVDPATGMDVFQYQNVGKVRLKGLEAQLGLWPARWAGVEVSYTYAINRYVSYTNASGTVLDGRDMRNSPRHRLNARFILKPVEGAKIELEWDHISSYYIDDANTATYNRPDLFHLSGSYRWNDLITVWGQIRNLADRKYANRVSDYGRGPSYRPGLPRSWAIGLTLAAKF